MWLSMNTKHINRKWGEQEVDDHFNRCQIWLISKSFYNKNKIQTSKRELPQCNKSHKRKPHSNIFSTVKDKVFLPRTCTRAPFFTFNHSTLYYKFSVNQREKSKSSKLKRRRKTVFICRWQESLYVLQENWRVNKLIQ